MKYFTHTTVYILIIFILVLFGLTLMAAPPTAALAAEEFIPLEPSLKSILTYDSNNLPGFFNSVFRLGVGAAALLAVIMIMIGGFQYLTSDIPGQKSDGKDKIKGAIYGLLLILLSVVILNVINPDITGFRLFNKSAPVQTPPPSAQTPPSNQTPPVSTAPILSQNVCYENVTDTVPGNQTTYRLVRIHNSETECTESCPVANVKFFCSDEPKILLERINRPVIIGG